MIDSCFICYYYFMQYRKLRKIINTYDPINLLALGTPKNEYNSEIKSIQKRLKENQTKKEIKEIVIGEFGYWFGKDLIKNRFATLNKIAQDIFKETDKI